MTIQTIEPLTGILGGALLLALVTVESGGWFLTRVASGKAPANALQEGFFRAGHAHAAVLLVLGLVIIALLDGAGLPFGLHLVASLGVPIAALLMPAGFFLSVLGSDPVKPGRAFLLLWIGAGVLTAGLVTAGVALIVAGAGAGAGAV
jgi:hypothetical protein